MPVPAELYESLRKRVVVFSRQSKRIYDGDVEALHRTRIATRRLRESFPVLGREAHATRKLDRRLKKVSRQLGAVRDVDVLIALIDQLQRERSYSKSALQDVRASVDEKRQLARQKLEARLPPEKLQKISRRLKRLAKHLQVDETSGHPTAQPRHAKATLWALDARATRRAARVRGAMAAAGTVYAPVPLHHVRIALKKLRFALELKAEVTRQPATREIAALKSAQDLLGRLHDLQVLLDQAREMQVARFGPDPGAWRELGLLVRTLERDCRKLHARYVRHSPKLVEIAAGVGDVKRPAKIVARRDQGERLLA
jgi:CHAD domain-containing protein